MRRLTVWIADDELLARRRLARLLGAMEGVEVLGECRDGVEALARLREGRGDAMLLDVEMPGLTGLEALGLAGATGIRVVFTTAHAEHAVLAFDREAVDYLLKPVEAARLARALDRVRRAVGEAEAPSAGSHDGEDDGRPVPPLARLPVATRRGVVLVDPATVSHVVLDGASCLVHAGDAVYVTDHRLADLEARLPPDLFVRAQRRALLNVQHVLRLEPIDTGGYLAHLRGGAVVEVSRQAARRLRRAWDLPR